jgi:F-type H+-transporting ATPase subunit delta
MKAEANSVAAQYAEAVLDIVLKTGTDAADLVLNDLKTINKTLTANPELGLVIGHPAVPTEEKRKIIVELFKTKIQEITLRLVELLLDKRRIYILPAIESEYHKYLNVRKNIVNASLISADKLSDSAVANIKARLTEHLGSSLELEVKVDPSLLGGVVLRLGDQVIDGSLKGKLQNLERLLTSV